MKHTIITLGVLTGLLLPSAGFGISDSKGVPAGPMWLTTNVPLLAPSQSEPLDLLAPISTASVTAPSPSTTETATTDSMESIFSHESSDRLDAVNEVGACGLGQALPCSKLSDVCPDWQTDRECQVAFFTNYANTRYGGWDNAWANWQMMGWW